MNERNTRVSEVEEEAVDPEVLYSCDPVKVCFVLRLFVMEVRKTNGENYPPSTIRNLLSGLNRVMVKKNSQFCILDKSDTRFRELHLTLDSVSSELHRVGVGVVKKSASVISIEAEDSFWEKGSLGTSSPAILQQTVFFYIGLQFVLRGVQEQHDLMVSQLERNGGVYSSSVYYQYTEYISKNNLHRFTNGKVKNKVVRAYALPGNDRCLVKLLDMYLPLLPSGSQYVYMRPLKAFPTDSEPGYSKQRVGVNQLKKFLPTIASKADSELHFTNHCLRATAVTRMYNQGVPEKLISEKSGHRTLEGLRSYEQSSVEMSKAAGEIIADPTKSFLDFGGKNPPTLSSKPSKAPVDPPEDPPKPPVDPQLPGFSGLTNCHITFNIYQK